MSRERTRCVFKTDANLCHILPDRNVRDASSEATEKPKEEATDDKAEILNSHYPGGLYEMKNQALGNLT